MSLSGEITKVGIPDYILTPINWKRNVLVLTTLEISLLDGRVTRLYLKGWVNGTKPEQTVAIRLRGRAFVRSWRECLLMMLRQCFVFGRVDKTLFGHCFLFRL